MEEWPDAAEGGYEVAQVLTPQWVSQGGGNHGYSVCSVQVQIQQGASIRPNLEQGMM